MGDQSQQFTRLQQPSPNGSSNSTNQAHLTYAADRAKVLFGCYRRGEANDPERYVASIAAVLACYDAELIREVTDPRTGISTHHDEDDDFRRFMPNSGQLKSYCEKIAARRARYAQYAALPKPAPKRLTAPPAGAGAWANVYVGPDTPQYAAMLARTQGADPREWRYDEIRPGVWVSLTWFDTGKSTFRRAAPTAEELREMYRAPEAAE